MIIPVNKSGNSVGVAVSAARLNAVLVDEHGQIINETSVKLDADNETLPQLTNFIRSLRAILGDFGSLGLAVPGLVNRAANRLEHSVYFPELSSGDLNGELNKAAECEVYIENDANSAAVGEHMAGVGAGNSSMFYIMLDAGVGGAFILNNELWRGAYGFAGEFGHIAVDTEGTRLEYLASASNIVRRTQERAMQDSTSSISQLHEGELTLGKIITAAESEDDLAIMMLSRTGSYVGVALANVINLFDPGLIVIGGQTSEAGDFLINSLKERAKELAFAEGFDKTDIHLGSLGMNAAATGVSFLARA